LKEKDSSEVSGSSNYNNEVRIMRITPRFMAHGRVRVKKLKLAAICNIKTLKKDDL
jgi:hypothetical protein